MCCQKPILQYRDIEHRCMKSILSSAHDHEYSIFCFFFFFSYPVKNFDVEIFCYLFFIASCKTNNRYKIVYFILSDLNLSIFRISYTFYDFGNIFDSCILWILDYDKTNKQIFYAWYKEVKKTDMIYFCPIIFQFPSKLFMVQSFASRQKSFCHV